MGYLSCLVRLLVAAFCVSCGCLGCTCVSLAPRAALITSEVVFHGRVKTLEHLRTLQKVDEQTGVFETWIPEFNDLTLVTFDIDTSWKGPAPASSVIKIFSVSRPRMCDGFSFVLGEEYTVFANRLKEVVPQIEVREDKSKIYDVGFCPGPMIPGPVNKGIAILGRPAQSRR